MLIDVRRVSNAALAPSGKHVECATVAYEPEVGGLGDLVPFVPGMVVPLSARQSVNEDWRNSNINDRTDKSL